MRTDPGKASLYYIIAFRRVWGVQRLLSAMIGC